MNDFELPKEILNDNLNFIREELERIEKQLKELESLKCYVVASDDAQTLIMGYMRLKTQLNSLLRHDFDAEH